MQFSLWLAKSGIRHNIFLITIFCIVMFLSIFLSLYNAIKESFLEFWNVFFTGITDDWYRCVWQWSKRKVVAKSIIEKNGEIKNEHIL